MQVMKPTQRAYQATGRITTLSSQRMVAHIFQKNSDKTQLESGMKVAYLYILSAAL